MKTPSNLKSKMLLVADSTHDIGIDEIPNEVDYRKRIDFDKIDVDHGWDWGIENISSTRQISLKPRLTQIQ